MKRPTLTNFATSRYSARAAITLWLVVAGFVWLVVGLAVTYAAHWTEGDIAAQSDRSLSNINPAAAGPGQDSSR